MNDLHHPNCRKCVLDVMSDEQANAVVAKIIEDEGHIDLLINNAGMPAAGLCHPPPQSRAVWRSRRFLWPTRSDWYT